MCQNFMMFWVFVVFSEESLEFRYKFILRDFASQLD